MAAKGSLSVPSYTKAGNKGKAVSLPKDIFGQEPNYTLLSQAVRVFLSNQRRARAKTKGRGEVAASTRKIWRQKGTGRARHGARSAPIFVGGGIAHGPRGIENYKLSLPRVMKKKALVSALSAKTKDGLLLVADLESIEPKTKKMVQFLEKVKTEGRVVIVHKGAKDLFRAGRNIENLNLVPAAQLTTYDVLAAGKVIFTREGLGELLGRLGT